MTERVVNHLIEFSIPGKPWLTWTPLEDGADLGKWQERLPGTRKKTRYRLVRRTAVITDEILDEIPQKGSPPEAYAADRATALGTRISDYQASDLSR